MFESLPDFRFTLPWALLLTLSPTSQAGTEELDFFETQIRPVLIKHCYECHSAASAEVKGGLRVDSRDALRKGGESGAAVVPGDATNSLLLGALRHETFSMPPDKKLPDAVIADFEQWIAKGAADPRDQPPSPKEASELSWKMVFEERRNWWSLQPLRKVDPPANTGNSWAAEPVDQFILKGLTDTGLTPSPDADVSTLARRLCFVLTGLPPSPEQITNFTADFSRNPDDALARFVDQLLGSVFFGERMARHWMDVVRYTDTYGYEWDNPAKGSWQYRDYLIRAFHTDIGFDQMVREQIAGDLLPLPRINQRDQLNESMIGPMFYHLGEHRHGDSLQFNGIHQEMVNNKVDAFSKAFLATTVACARCHDHKLDAVAQRDFYALGSVFITPRWTSRVVDTPDRHSQAIEELKALREKIHEAMTTRWHNAAATLPAELSQALTQPGGDDMQLARWRTAFAVDAKDKKTSIENFEHPVLHLLAAADDAEIAKRWEELVGQWRAIHDPRVAEKATYHQVLTDFSEPGLPAGWTSEGDGIRHGYVTRGTPLVALKADRIVERILGQGIHTNALSPKLPGSVRTPRLQTWGKAFVSVQLSGGDWAGHLTIPENAFQSERVVFLDSLTPAWHRFETFTANADWNVRSEIATSDLNPNFPPRTGLARAGSTTLPDNDSGFDKPSWFSLTEIVLHDAPGTPQDSLKQFEPLYSSPTPADKTQAFQRVGDWLAGAVLRWCDKTARREDITIVNWLLANDLLPNRIVPGDELDQLVTRYRQVEASIGFPRTVNGMDEVAVTPTDYPLHVRGNVDEPGELVPRDFLQVFDGRHGVASSAGSGRLELAEYLVDRDHPLTARVYVNRVWGWIFGNNLAGTPDDFGHLGQLPSHPELLDYLARQFIEEGWSTKKLIRRLVLSRTFRQSGQVSDLALETDPDNRLLHHYPTRRLEAEAIRDTMLAVSGRLDPSPFGRPIDPPRAKEDPSKRLYSGPVDGAGRRSIYTKITIMEPPKFLAAFNQPSPKIPVGKRDATNVPAQALALLNDPFVAGQAEHWAQQLVQKPHASVTERINEMFFRALGRPARPEELELWSAAVSDFHGKDAEQVTLLADVGAWTRIAHALFNTKEFLYYR